MEIFNFNPFGDVKRVKHPLDRTIDFESGAFQVQKVGVNPMITFEATYQGTKEQIKLIEDFYDVHGKTEKFTLPYDGKHYTVQFTSDFAPTDTWGWDKSGKIIAKVSVSLTMRVVHI
jgi:phage-related protein